MAQIIGVSSLYGDAKSGWTNIFKDFKNNFICLWLLKIPSIYKYFTHFHNLLAFTIQYNSVLTIIIQIKNTRSSPYIESYVNVACDTQSPGYVYFIWDRTGLMVPMKKYLFTSLQMYKNYTKYQYWKWQNLHIRPQNRYNMRLCHFATKGSMTIKSSIIEKIYSLIGK